MLLRKLAFMVSSISLASLAYLYYVRRCYKYLKSLGYDGPAPKFFIGNLTEFMSKENSVSDDPNKPPVAHYSKTLQRWTKIYGKIYGFYEGHSPVIVLADPDLVTEVFVNQSKLLAYRRSFPMSKPSSDPTADIFLNNGIRWIRVRYGLEKIMLNSKNTARCLEYADESFINTFISQPDLKTSQSNFNIHQRAKVFMVQAMFYVIFGKDINTFLNEKQICENSELYKNNDFFNKRRPKDSLLKINDQSLLNAHIIANQFNQAFLDFETFSLLKFMALTIPELNCLWIRIEKFKAFFNSSIYAIAYFANPMDWFYTNFIYQHLLMYIATNSIRQPTNTEKKRNSLINNTIFSVSNAVQNQTSKSLFKISNSTINEKFGLFSSFLYLTYNSIIKYQYESPYRKLTTSKENSSYRNRAFTTTERYASTSSIKEINSKSRSFSERKFPNSSSNYKLSDGKTKIRHHSIDLLNNEDQMRKRSKLKSYLSSNTISNEIESEEFENWKLTIDEALSNSLLMFFAGYETTSSVIGFCCHVISKCPEQRVKLLEEITEYWMELSSNLKKYGLLSFNRKNQDGVKFDNLTESDEDRSDSNEDDESSLNDDVFEDSHKESSKTSKRQSLEEWNDLYETLEKMKYLDMFVKETLRMFPIASSMVSRKCMTNMTIGNGNYFIPKGMNVVVDVLSIHYDPVLWGPVDPELFYPERFLTERNPAAWLPFGIGCRKCLGMRLATSQIKLFIVRLLQSFLIEEGTSSISNKDQSKEKTKKIFETIETKEIFFNGPIQSINVTINRKNHI